MREKWCHSIFALAFIQRFYNTQQQLIIIQLLYNLIVTQCFIFFLYPTKTTFSTWQRDNLTLSAQTRY